MLFRIAILSSVFCTLGLLPFEASQAQTTASEIQTTEVPAETAPLLPDAEPTAVPEPVSSPFLDVRSASQSSADSTLTLLKPGDRIQVTVVGFPELSGDHTILADGTVQVPMAGNIGVWGLTPDQTVSKVSTALMPYVRRPQVGITLLNVRPPRISVTGQVRRPGLYQVLPPDTSDENQEVGDSEGFQTLSYALSLAGGITPDADLRRITIKRVQPGQLRAGRNQRLTKTEIEVNLWEAVQTGDLSSDLRIYDGDEIIVPTATLSSAEQQALLNSTVAPLTVGVQVGGEVRRPGTVQIQPSGGINAAIAAAGGPTDAANIRSVYLLRTTENGQVEREEFEFGRSDSGPLRDGDVVIVERSGTRNFLDFLGRILGPLAIFENIVD